MSLKSFLTMQQFAAAVSQVEQLKAKLAAHLAEDRDAIEKEFREAIAHFEAEVQALRAKMDPLVLAHIDDGVPPHGAYQMAQAGEPTKAQKAAAAQ